MSKTVGRRVPRTISDKFYDWLWDGFAGGGINDDESDAPGNVAHRTFKGVLWSPFCEWMAKAYNAGYLRGKRDAQQRER